MIAPVGYIVRVHINGFTCETSADVDNAWKHIDPQHPSNGPFDVNAAQPAPGASAPKPNDVTSTATVEPASRGFGADPALGSLVDLRT
jgi:hypothetical protein